MAVQLGSIRYRGLYVFILLVQLILVGLAISYISSYWTVIRDTSYDDAVGHVRGSISQWSDVLPALPLNLTI